MISRKNCQKNFGLKTRENVGVLSKLNIWNSVSVLSNEISFVVIFLDLCGTNQSNVIVKPIDAFPALYKEKLFKPPEMKPLELVKTELETPNIGEDIEDNDEDNEESDQNVAEDEEDEEIGNVQL